MTARDTTPAHQPDDGGSQLTNSPIPSPHAVCDESHEPPVGASSPTPRIAVAVEWQEVEARTPAWVALMRRLAAIATPSNDQLKEGGCNS